MDDNKSFILPPIDPVVQRAIMAEGYRSVLPRLTELQEGRCFYCRGKLRAPEVEHFLPRVSVSLEAVENLVVADVTCNREKGNHLPAPTHIAAWRGRSPQSLADIANLARWETSPDRAVVLARGLYFTLTIDARLWLRADVFVPANPAQLRALLAA